MKKKYVFYLSILVLMGSCYPNDTVYYEDTDIVYTNYDDQFDFGSKGVYSIPDKIVKLSGSTVDGEEPEYVKEPYNTQMLQKMESNMTALGWEKTEDPADADLVLFPSVWTNTTVYYWYDYWCWYYPYYCGWGWGYPTVSSYTTGTLLMTLVADGDEYIDPADVWTATANGLVSGAYNVNRVNNAIDQAFKQSLYLKTN
jgi:hypothetical protein